ncbi:MAG: PilT/PilU family type 4a pilus ATPase [Desulfobacterales bacterium]|nr:PilT/PilU family type 4a pilus ATPase [Desulfobacterales bacterium]
MLNLLKKAVKAEASDLHLTTGAPPILRIHGELIIIEDEEPLTNETNKELIYSILNETQKNKALEDLELCFSLNILDLGYFRITIYFQRGMIEASIRIGMVEAKTIKELELPLLLSDMVRRPNGIILITGATGQGKTTTFYALIDFINKDRRCKIITVEDPVEYVHKNIKSIVVQQELYLDTKSFDNAIRHILRQNPDIIGVGEMRDLETISAAITAAETGHLVIATLHTNDCAQTINRIIDVFPSHQQDQIRTQLASTLNCIINQKLLPRVDKKGRVLAYEFLIANDAVRTIIRDNKLQMINNTIQTARNQGMVTLDEMIKNFYQKGMITYDTAIANAKDLKSFKMKASV